MCCDPRQSCASAHPSPLPCAMSRRAPATWTVHASHAGASYAGETISQVSPCLEHERRAALAVHAVRWECVFDGICEDLARTQALFCMSPLRAGSAGHALFASRPHGQNGTRTSIVNTMMHAHLLSGGGLCTCRACSYTRSSCVKRYFHCMPPLRISLSRPPVRIDFLISCLPPMRLSHLAGAFCTQT